ncbi:GNAT superfamily N-acetyltransferase [Erwinia persicina]|jgi:GNAT superfamily N-acetyltransferase|uniref:PanD regulatory factor n=2 Tax=Erwinia TaxID=551 RepID=A0ABV4EAK8_9GAMM|nr:MULTISPECIES: aspartate 1-decarboxylase autocleavage activator PanM [Erwinia]MCP1439227.1 GNAT superfamily N-acetyltransferase [Erwinia persicina]MDN4627388.1 aspartate 1-decarboxylase autocleavage activator PanM [Erwinia sp. PsM31]MDN8543606.1 aspartate 1-decarboxylase autocleavage activator PanM [Erwinia sp. BC051422]
MKLTILRLQRLSAQDLVDLSKIWPQDDPADLENRLDDRHRLYAAKFNDRLLAAVKVTLNEAQGELKDFMVREVTRRRGVGSYLLEEVLAQNAAVTRWRMAKTGDEGLSTFMRKQGFIADADGWVWQRA